MKSLLNEKELGSVRKCYNNIFSLLLKDSVSPEVKACILKWGLQLGIPKSELDIKMKTLKSFNFSFPTDRLNALEEVYDLVYMIYLDGIVEDIELEVAMDYAEKLGLNRKIVGDIFTALATAPHDGLKSHQVRQELKGLLEMSLYNT
jgi:hypothetical protein